ncbi:transporter [Ganoderma sinense ZZ0214-1]|uniref:Transporter n=1 Tax=Ganoderma sinense ZZ0214-1 TaxID=1077348 RepID=A0A2G8SBZ1_9APHY|nr:transporter [Ganoderma sinense ZZ0214-1]
MDTEGASNNERLLAAARSDNENMLLEVFDEGGFDINFQDGLGNTALHYAASNGFLDIMEHILEYEGCDVDPQNRIEKATPLHLAVRLEDPEDREAIVASLLDAGADTKIKDKNGELALSFVPPDDTATLQLFKKATAQSSISRDDIANDDDDDEEGSGSGSDDE